MHEVLRLCSKKAGREPETSVGCIMLGQAFSNSSCRDLFWRTTFVEEVGGGERKGKGKSPHGKREKQKREALSFEIGFH